jgi:hypothetical protein
MNNPLEELAHIVAVARADRVRRELAAQKDNGPGYCSTEAARCHIPPQQEVLYDTA